MKAKRRPDDRAVPEAEEVASATECTGLMPALPRDDAEDESAAALYGIHDGNGARNAPRPAR